MTKPMHDFELNPQALDLLELGALPHAPLEMPAQTLESPAMQAVMQAGGLVPFVLRYLMTPRQAAKAGH